MKQLWNCGFPSSLPELAFLAALAGLIAYAAVSDIRGFRIPNIVSIALITLFFARYAIVSPAISLEAHLMFAGVIFAILFVFYVLGWFGAGDAKLITAIMLWAGPDAGPLFLLVLALAGGAFAAFLLILRKALRARIEIAAYVPSSRLIRCAERGVCPYGIPIFVATVLVSPLFFNAPACKSSQPLPALTFQLESNTKLFFI